MGTYMIVANGNFITSEELLSLIMKHDIGGFHGIRCVKRKGNDTYELDDETAPGNCELALEAEVHFNDR